MKSSEKAYFPLFVDLSDKKIVVAGAGNIAGRRIKVLTDFCADITVIAPQASDEVLNLADEGEIKLIKKPYEKEDINGAFIVLAATDDPDLNKKIHNDCKEKGITVNISSDKTLCDFYFPGIVKDGSMVVGVSASGTAHKKARLVREAAKEAIDKILAEE